MKKAVIFGAGSIGQCFYFKFKEVVSILYVVDNDSKKWNREAFESFPASIQIKPPSALLEQDYDVVFIAVKNGAESIYKQLCDELRIPQHKIDLRTMKDFVDFNDDEQKILLPRIQFIESFAGYVYMHNIQGSVAEAGVFRGDFAKEISRVFPDKRLYLFDTFEGFDERDLGVEKEKNPNYEDWENTMQILGSFSATSVDTVLKRMPYPKNCVIKEGYFPETFDIENETFCFVNLDMDMYKPIKAGLELFYPLMSRGGVILVHEYFINGLAVAEAVDAFAAANALTIIPIGDLKSAAIVKN